MASICYRRIETFFAAQVIVIFVSIFANVVVIGSVAGGRGVVLGVVDKINYLMAILNLIALLLLSGTVFSLANNYRFED